MLAMINSLLDVSKFEAGELAPIRSDCDLVALAHEVVTLLTAGRDGQRVTVESASPTLTAAVDRELISRVLQNLLGNAFKFSRYKGSVEVRMARENGGVRVEVIDHGPGISAQYHERIFQKFGQVSSDHQRVGTGLGLTFCRLAVEAHGGRIGVTSEVGKGSTFWFCLPDARA
jgi:signal transduction histidine kinase